MRAQRKAATTGREAAAPTTRALVLTKKPRRTTAHVSATASCIAAISGKRSRADTTPSLVCKIIVTITVTATITAIRIVVGGTGIVTAVMAVPMNCAKLL